MARSTYFFTKKKLNEILKLYGGGYRWTLHEELSEKRQISYMDKKGCMLTINEAYEGKNGQFTYVEVRISDANGKIIRKDRFDFTHTNTDDIEFVYSEENGHFYSDFRKVGMTMARATKESKIKKLEENVKSLQESLEILSKRYTEMQQRGEDSYLNSPTYYQMQERMDFYKTLADLNQSYSDSQRKWRYRQNDAVQQVYADNKRLMEQAGGEYFIGITEGEHSEREFNKLREEIRELKGKLDGKNLNLVARDEYIEQLIEQIADLKAQNTALMKVSDDVVLDKSFTIQELVKASHSDTVDKAVQSLTTALEEAQTTITDLRKQAEKTLVEKNKAQMARVELRKEKNRKYNKYNASDEESYDSMLHTYYVVMDQLQLSNENHEKLSQKIKEQEQEIADLKAKKEDTAEVSELQKQIEKLQDDVRKAEGQCKVYQANVFKITESRDIVQRKLGEARQRISELETQIESIFHRNSDPDLITMYHALEERTEKSLDNLRKARKEAKEWKEKYQELKEKQTTTPPPVETESKEPQSVGRPKTDDAKIQKVLKMREDGKPMRTIATELGISLGTVSNIVKKHSK